MVDNMPPTTDPSDLFVNRLLEELSPGAYCAAHDGSETFNGVSLPDNNLHVALDADGGLLGAGATAREAVEDACLRTVRGLARYSARVDSKLQRITDAIKVLRSVGVDS